MNSPDNILRHSEEFIIRILELDWNTFQHRLIDASGKYKRNDKQTQLIKIMLCKNENEIEQNTHKKWNQMQWITRIDVKFWFFYNCEKKKKIK